MADKKPTTIPVLLKFAIWNPDRIEAGTTVDLPIETAKALIAEKKAERADPMPGE